MGELPAAFATSLTSTTDVPYLLAAGDSKGLDGNAPEDKRA